MEILHFADLVAGAPGYISQFIDLLAFFEAIFE